MGHLFFWVIMFLILVFQVWGISRPEANRMLYGGGFLLWLGVCLLGYLTIGFRL